MRLAQQFGIPNRKRIEEVKNKGSLLQSSNFGVAILKNEGAKFPRFAFVISAKISKIAVHRNRLTRALHEGVRRNLGNIPKEFDFVILAKKSIVAKNTEDLVKEVEIFFSKLKELK